MHRDGKDVAVANPTGSAGSPIPARNTGAESIATITGPGHVEGPRPAESEPTPAPALVAGERVWTYLFSEVGTESAEQN